MSLALSPSTRKRTVSFCAPSSPRPTKALRLTPQMGGSLKRSETCLSLFELNETRTATTTTTIPTTSTHTSRDGTPIPYTRSLQYQKDQRYRRKLNAKADNDHPPLPQTMPIRRGAPQQPTPSRPPPPRSSSNSRSSRPKSALVLSTASPSVRRMTPPTKVILPSAKNPHAVVIYTTQRTSSPLAPVQTPLPARPTFPRSRVEPDLYKKALIGRMKTTDEGRNVLTMGARIAISIYMATKDLEKMVEDTYRRERDLDIVMGNTDRATPRSMTTQSQPALSNSWVVVKPTEDWEMVDCLA